MRHTGAFLFPTVRCTGFLSRLILAKANRESELFER
jgi:hypothetical protein